jgi:hypothetical protein
MKAEEKNNNIKETEHSSKFAGALPFILIFGGLTVVMILAKILMALFE